MVRLALVALIASTAIAQADERIHMQPPTPAECRGSDIPSGYCVRGGTWYRLDSGRVKWILQNDTNDPRFWQEQDKDKFGIGDGGGTGSEGSGK